MDWRTHVREAFGADSLPDNDVIEELAQHAAATYEAAVADGREPADAVREVAAQISSWTRDRVVRRRRPRRPPLSDAPPSSRSRFAGLAHDVRQAARLLRRQPGYSAVVIATMALGICATTSLFSVAYGVLLKPLPWPHSDRLIRLYETRHGGTSRFGPMMTSLPYIAWRERATTIDALAAWSPDRVTMGSTGDLVRIRIAGATASLFPLLGARPELGALYTERDETLQQQAPAIISYALWQERYGLDPGAIGRAIRFDGTAYRIVAVMPKTFAFPDRETRAWIPFAVRAQPGGLSMFAAIARLKPGVTPAQAAAEAMGRARGVPDPGVVVLAVFGSNGRVEISAVPLLESQIAGVRPAILVFLIAVGLLLATATANVASIQLARAADRRREIAIRSALGAGTAPLVRQFLVESTILGLCGGLAGLVLAAALLRVLPSLLPAGFPRLADVTLNLPAASFAIGLSLVASVLFGLVPAMQARGVTLTPSLAEDGRATGVGLRLRTGRARALIIAAQIAIACVLLVGTALLARSFVGLLSADRGYDPTSVLTAALPWPDEHYTGEQRARFMTDLLERLRAVPGVSHAALTTALPLTPGETAVSFPVRSGRTGRTVQAHAVSRVVSPDYFATLHIRLVEGRLFDARDTGTSRPVVVVNKAFVREYLRAHPIGDSLYDDGEGRAAPVIIGVIENVHHRSVTDPPAVEIYTTTAQSKDDLVRTDRLMLAIRTVGDPAAFSTTLRAIVRQQDPSVALDSVTPMEDLFRTSLAEPRLYSVLLATLAFLALAIAAVGLFGVLIYSVTQRSREIAVRTALGARPIDVVGLVLRQGLGIALAGLGLGLGVALASAKALSTFLYGITPYDTVTFVVVPLVLLVVAGLACVVPARRAARIDPVHVLRG